jgi:signal transduction histidine kinase
VAIVDIQMPEMDGYELVELLRSNKDTSTLPAIFVSAIYSDEYHHRKGYEAGAVDFMSKPVIAEILLSKVKVFIDLYQQRKALQEANEVLSKRAVQLETSSQVSQQVTSILDLNELLKEVVASIQSRFGYYFVGIWLLSDQPYELTLQAGISYNRQALDTGFSMSPNGEQNSVAQVCRTGVACLIRDVEAEAGCPVLARLPETRSELVLPLRMGQQTIGALDIRSQRLAGFDIEDQRVLQTLANQIAIAIRNALMYEMEKELRSTEKEKAQGLAALNADKDKFFSIISHDLRGPFNTVLGNARLLVKGIDTLGKQDIQEMTQDIYDGAQAAYNLLDNLLTWSRIQREGGNGCSPEPVELSCLAQGTLEVLEQTAVQKEIKLSNAIAAGLWVQADRYMLETVIRNLVGNALKFTPRGGRVTLTARTDGEEDKSGFVTVSVKDSGVGIGQADLTKLFRLDTHHTTPGTEKERGSGLGLIICQEMVERNGGKIQAQSELGKGTVVEFTIPWTAPPTA